MRKHYMTLCARGNIEVTHIRDDSGAITVTFEQAVRGGFNTLETTLEGQVLSNEGFTPSDVAYFLTFLRNNKSAIYAESIGEL